MAEASHETSEASVPQLNDQLNAYIASAIKYQSDLIQLNAQLQQGLDANLARDIWLAAIQADVLVEVIDNNKSLQQIANPLFDSDIAVRWIEWLKGKALRFKRALSLLYSYRTVSHSKGVAFRRKTNKTKKTKTKKKKKKIQKKIMS